MNATPRYFRRLYAGDREVNHGNTVLVRRDSGQWWLGYVQDIDGDQFFVDFDSTTTRAEWIHASRLWPHFLLNGAVPAWIGSAVQVALSTVEGGPLVFRRGTITGEMCLLYYIVRLDGDEGNSIAVHRTQFVERLPVVEQESSLFAKYNGFMYRKYVINWDGASLLRDVTSLPRFLLRTCRIAPGQDDLVCDASCQVERFDGWDAVSYYCVGTHAHLNIMNEVAVGCRVFVRAGSDTLTFICAEMRGDVAGRSLFWNEQSLREACHLYFVEQQGKQGGIIPVIHGVDGLQLQNVNSEAMRMTDLFHPVLADILLHLDVTTQLRTSRVCSLWRALLREFGAHRHVIVEIPWFSATTTRNGELTTEHCYLVYKLATILEQTVSRETRTLALLDQRQNYDEFTQLFVCFPWKMSAVKKILQSKGIRLQRIISKKGIDPLIKPGSALLGLYNQQNDNNYECRALSALTTVCEEILLIDYTASDPRFLKLLVICLFNHTGAPWPTNLTHEGDSIGHSQPNVAIPFLRCSSTETAVERRRRFLAVVNDNCVAVNEEDYAKVTALHAGWLQTLAYPEEWTGIRMFLQLFCPFSTTDSAVCWDAVDLRELDVSSLNRLAIHILVACCED
ncbi:uncharacterized protein LOC129583688 [Paramacrobiotus metropolitanus]|uniref:uncharacterized protein LOC129583688 n=1 Tax=Paramacrobiotus metropolitanus TaxID=2943436 RepID=UPI002445B781|nr:uncharacterized protein LOC129583688 [Paramacrobiotus metropolitanus]